MKSIYFPSTDFLHANKGSRASWGWSSLLSRMDVIKEDGVWSMGNGRSIQAFRDRWVLSALANRIEPCIVNNNQQEEVRVEAWIDHDQSRWNEQRVRAAISPRNADEVLQIPLPTRPREDKLRWPFMKDDMVSIKSTYHRLRERIRVENSSSQAGTGG